MLLVLGIFYTFINHNENIKTLFNRDNFSWLTSYTHSGSASASSHWWPSLLASALCSN
jgi:hypothetical protein